MGPLPRGAVEGTVEAAVVEPTVVLSELVPGTVGIVVARPPLMRALGRRPGPLLRSGAESMIGERAILQEPILGPDRPGHVRIAGELWPALTATGAAVPAGTPVVVRALRSATLIVEVDDPPSAQAPTA